MRLDVKSARSVYNYNVRALIGADISVNTAEEIVDEIRAEAKQEKLRDKQFMKRPSPP